MIRKIKTERFDVQEMLKAFLGMKYPYPDFCYGILTKEGHISMLALKENPDKRYPLDPLALLRKRIPLYFFIWYYSEEDDCHVCTLDNKTKVKSEQKDTNWGFVIREENGWYRFWYTADSPYYGGWVEATEHSGYPPEAEKQIAGFLQRFCRTKPPRTRPGRKRRLPKSR